MKTQLLIMIVAAVLATGCAREASHDDNGHAHDDHDEDVARGPHGGRLFTDDGMQLELRIMEEDGPPEFVAYLYDDDGERIAPGDATLHVTLDRFAGRRDEIAFASTGNLLRGDTEVREPHSFAATITLEKDGRTHHWTYDQVEYRVRLTAEAVERAGITVVDAGPGHIDVTVDSPGEVRLNTERMLVVRPRFPGVVSRLHQRLGDAVARGDTVATVQSNNSLTEYAITSPTKGTIVARSGMVGAAVDNATVLYTLADLSTVWVDFAIYPQHVGVIESGQPVTVTSATREDLVAEGTVSYVGPMLEQDTRVSYGRVVLDNAGGHWQPGLYVTVRAVVDHADVAVMVPDEAIVRSKFGPAVFIAEGSTFELQPVVTGRSDGVNTEIVDGIAAGTAVVASNTFLLKAELGRSEATHDH
jgi:cobalt-zinc-cadmium efflux system membrane fusion protein